MVHDYIRFDAITYAIKCDADAMERLGLAWADLKVRPPFHERSVSPRNRTQLPPSSFSICAAG
jgi:hypothetical protein